MDKRKISFVCIMLCVMLSLCSCSGVFSDPKTLMHPPLADGELSGIEDALKSAISGKYSFVYPSSGSYRTGCISKDIRGNGTDEAIVFYSIDDTSEIRMNYLSRNSDEKWQSVSDVQVTGTGIDRVEFADVCGDGTLEILLGSNMYNSKEKQLSVYSISDNSLNLKTQESYTDFAVCDLTGNAKPQLLLLTLGTLTVNKEADSAESSVRNYATAKLISLSEGTDGITTVIGSVELDQNITAFSAITEGKIKDGINGVYIDSYKGADVMITELVYFDKKLHNEFYSESLGENNATRRQVLINSRDIDSDGRIEIPEGYVMPGYESAEPADKVYYTVWKRYNGKSFEPSATGVFNSSDGYFLSTPDSWTGKITLERRTEEKMRIFYVWDFDKKQYGAELFRIKVFSNPEWNSDAAQGYTEIESKGGRIYAVKLGDGEADAAYDISLDFIKKNFKLI